MSEIRDYVLVWEDGFWEYGDVKRRREIVRAFTAEDAKSRWRCTSFGASGGGHAGEGLKPRQRLVDVEPYDPDRAEHKDIERRDHAGQ